MQQMKIYEALRWASSFLEKRGLEVPIAEILLTHFLQMNRSQLLQNFHELVPETVQVEYTKALQQIAKGTPVQYVTGYEFFLGRKFQVNSHVLIPRPETEELVLGVLKRIQQVFLNKEKLSVVDVGTGSGAIAVTLAVEDPALLVTTIDISGEAIAVAKTNAAALNADVKFLEGDLLAPLLSEKTKVDVIVSNPPYISEEDFQQLEGHVRDHEPTLALVGGVTGYELYEKLIAQIPYVLNKPGIVAFEVGVGQSKRVEALIKEQYPCATTEIVLDINKKDRMVYAIVSEN